jgi:hydroxymethylbilane synthase
MTTAAPRTKLTIATRGSQLALWQADYIAGLLAKRGVKTEKLIIKTTADRVQDRFLHEMGGKGLFVKELEEALADKRADLAVHSLKDMPARLPDGMTLAAIHQRHSPFDALLLRADHASKLPTKDKVVGAAGLAALRGLTIGTGSLRRSSLFKAAGVELTTVPIRGNVDTRIRKMTEGQWDGIVLAEASLDRLTITDVARWRLDPEWFVPSPAQGALAIETRDGDAIAPWLDGVVGDTTTRLCITIERDVLARLGGDCTMPFAAYARLDGATVTCDAALLARDGKTARARCTGSRELGSRGLSDLVCKELARQGAADVLRQLGLPVPAEFGS